MQAVDVVVDVAGREAQHAVARRGEQRTRVVHREVAARVRQDHAGLPGLARGRRPQDAAHERAVGGHDAHVLAAHGDLRVVLGQRPIGQPEGAARAHGMRHLGALSSRASIPETARSPCRISSRAPSTRCSAGPLAATRSSTHPHARLVRDARVPLVYDANLVGRVRARTPAEIDAVLAAADARSRVWRTATSSGIRGMPQEFEARLLLEGYGADDDLILVLEGELAQRGPALEVRAVESDADWRTLEALCRLDHEEEVAQGFHDAVGSRASRARSSLAKRLKAPDVRYVLARADGVDCAFFSRLARRERRRPDRGPLHARRLPRPRHRHGPDRGLRRRRAQARRRPRPDRRARERHAEADVRGAGLPPAVRAAQLREDRPAHT